MLQLPLNLPSQILNLLSKVFDIEFAELMRAKRFGLTHRPRVIVALVAGAEEAVFGFRGRHVYKGTLVTITAL